MTPVRLELAALGLESSTIPLSHSAPKLPFILHKIINHGFFYKNLSDSWLILFITNKKCSEPTPLVLDNFRRFSSNSSKVSGIIYNAVSKSFFM